MNANEYLKSLQEENPAPAPAPQNTEDADIKAALARQDRTFREELAKRDAELAALKEAQQGPDPESHIFVNGKAYKLPEDEDTWQEWIKQARGAVANAEDPDQARAGYEDFMGRYYAWRGAKAAKDTLEKAGKVRDPDPKDDVLPESDKDSVLEAVGLVEGTKGRVAVEVLMESGRTLKEALDSLGVDTSNVRVPMTRNERNAAMERANQLPDSDANQIDPPADVIRRARGGAPEDINKSMNAALAARLGKRRNTARIFKRA